jgi:hypothetical protein
MYTKKNTRVTFRSNKRSNFKRNNNFSNGKTRNKGNITQQYNKYLKLAKEASSSGDRIQSEYYYQFTEHYYRLMLELGITLEENELQESKTNDQTFEENVTVSEKNESLDKKKDENLVKASESKKEENEDVESIESVPFISEPIKKKVTRNKKASA